jgi:hypothetical protein
MVQYPGNMDFKYLYILPYNIIDNRLKRIK